MQHVQRIPGLLTHPVSECLVMNQQLRIVAPRAIVALGRSATEGLGLMPSDGRSWRGKLREYQGIPTMPTYHPAFLLRSPQFKKQVWDDLKIVMAHLGRPTPRG